MADPVIVDCPKDVWTKVADNVVNGFLHKKSSQAATYLQTYRQTGEAAPDDVTDKPQGVAIFRNDQQTVKIQSSIAIDVYVMPIGADGKIRADLI